MEFRPSVCRSGPSFRSCVRPAARPSHRLSVVGRCVAMSADAGAAVSNLSH